jgi:osmotically-inducible protein OsmY
VCAKFSGEFLLAGTLCIQMPLTSSFQLVALLPLALCLTAAEVPKPAAKAQPKPAAKTQLSDAAIEQNIRARFAKSKVAADKFQVKVQAGVATIEGKTDVIQHKGSATRMAKTGGAIQVVNKIQISDTARQRATANLEKGRKKAEVKRL